MFELTKDSSCNFKIWQNSLSRYGKWLSYQDIRKLLKEKSLEVQLISKKYGKKIYYDKYIVLNHEYGVSVLWD